MCYLKVRVGCEIQEKENSNKRNSQEASLRAYIGYVEEGAVEN